MTKLMKISFIMKLGELLQSGYSTEQALSFFICSINKRNATYHSTYGAQVNKRRGSFLQLIGYGVAT